MEPITRPSDSVLAELEVDRNVALAELARYEAIDKTLEHYPINSAERVHAVDMILRWKRQVHRAMKHLERFRQLPRLVL